MTWSRLPNLHCNLLFTVPSLIPSLLNALHYPHEKKRKEKKEKEEEEEEEEEKQKLNVPT